jgi:guanosine-3',5'-bis(diphosphate) 3'-pyrophosphohydrolase
MSNLTNIEKVRIALRYFLIGKGFTQALKAFDYAERLHTGLRKDGVTPSFHHQISIANYLTTLPLDNTALETAIILAFLHDTPEDKGVSYEEIQTKFGDDIAHGSILLAKKYRGNDIPKEKYFGDLALHAMPALVKGADRMNNLSTMHGVFKIEKQQSYVDETIAYHLPMLKTARRNFPEYHMAFENVKIGILAWVNSTQNYLNAMKQS